MLCTVRRSRSRITEHAYISIIFVNRVQPTCTLGDITRQLTMTAMGQTHVRTSSIVVAGFGLDSSTPTATDTVLCSL